MYCPRCASQNADETKYCRGCGADLSAVLAAVEGRALKLSAGAERHIELYSSGLRGLITGLGFFLVAGLGLALSSRLAVLVLFALAFASFFVGTGISRLFQARALKRLSEPQPGEPTPALSAGREDYIRPVSSIYQTEDLAATPRTVTEHTTAHLKMDPEIDEK